MTHHIHQSIRLHKQTPSSISFSHSPSSQSLYHTHTITHTHTLSLTQSLSFNTSVSQCKPNPNLRLYVFSIYLIISRHSAFLSLSLSRFRIVYKTPLRPDLVTEEDKQFSKEQRRRDMKKLFLNLALYSRLWPFSKSSQAWAHYQNTQLVTLSCSKSCNLEQFFPLIIPRVACNLEYENLEKLYLEFILTSKIPATGILNKMTVILKRLTSKKLLGTWFKVPHYRL